MSPRHCLGCCCALLSCVLWPRPARSQDWRALAEESREGTPYELAPAAHALDAPEPPPAPFGGRGQWVITGASNVSVGSRSYESKATYTGVTVAPGLDYFVLRNFSVGVTADVGYADDRGYLADGTFVETRSTSVRGGPRVGLNLPLASRLSVYPRLAAGYGTSHANQQAVGLVGNGAVSHDGAWGAVDVPVVFVPEAHFFVAVVPSVVVDVSSGVGNTAGGGPYSSFGVGFLVGGWLGGAEPPPSAPSPPPLVEDEPQPAPQLQRFGNKGVFVLDSELNAFGYSTKYGGGSTATATSYGLVAGIDYFVFSHVSIGAAFAGTYSGGSGTYLLDGSAYTSSSDAIGFGVRVGIDWPLAHFLSLYARGTLWFGGEDFDSESRGYANKGSDQYTNADLYVPLLFHLARHFFVGFGPEASGDLSRTYTPGSVSNKANYVGAGVVVGGWL